LNVQISWSVRVYESIGFFYSHQKAGGFNNAFRFAQFVTCTHENLGSRTIP
jgi:hypothetical protein